MTTGYNIFAYLETHAALAPPQIVPEPTDRVTLLSMPPEVVQMIVNATFKDTKSLQNVRATCKTLKQLSEKHFRESYLTHLIVSPTRRALARLSWTVQEPKLAANIQSITVTYDNTNLSTSSVLCPGMWIVGEVDYLLRALRHLDSVGKQVDLIVNVAKTPADGTSTIISIAYPVLIYVLSGHGARGIKKLSLDFDDTVATHLPIYTTSQQILALDEDFGPRYQRIWACIMFVKNLNEVRIRFRKKNEKVDSDTARFVTIVRQDTGMHVGMQYLSTWHFDIMGRMNIFNRVFTLNIQHCGFIRRHRDDLFKNPNLRALVLWNNNLYAIQRSINPPTTIQTLKNWYCTLAYIAANTALQSCKICFLHDSDGQIHHRQPWILEPTSERSVNQTLRLKYPF